MPRLFDLPTDATQGAFPLGGLGAGHFGWDPDGMFRDWRLHPGEPMRPGAVAEDAFHLWVEGRAVTLARGSAAWPVGLAQAPGRRTLFPLAWTGYRDLPAGLEVESVTFSPLLPGEEAEPSLPLSVVVWRLRNPGARPVRVAMMLTWACGWPDVLAGAGFDYQQDNLCLTGALGLADSPERVGIALPDLHSEGIYQQGIEPWDVAAGVDAVWEDFAEDGELDPAVPRGASLGAAAWVKLDIEPFETAEVPFALAWHFPTYRSGAYAGHARRYTRFLGKRRPDNAIVWLAERAFQKFGAETPNYRYWLQQLTDGQRASSPPPDAAAVLECDSVWPDDGPLLFLPTPGEDEAAAARAAQALWPRHR